MGIAITSRMALREIEGRLGPQCRRVWRAIRDWPGEPGPSIRDLATALAMETATVSARISALRAAGAIENGPLKRGTTGLRQKTYRALVWRAPAGEPGQMQLL